MQQEVSLATESPTSDHLLNTHLRSPTECWTLCWGHRETKTPSETGTRCWLGNGGGKRDQGAEESFMEEVTDVLGQEGEGG